MANSLSDTTFESEVLDAEGPVLVDFWAAWCAPCQTLSRLLDRIEEAAAGHAIIYKLNVDENPLTAQEYNIRSLPTVIVFKNGEEVKRLIGLQHPENYLQALDLEIV